MELKILIPGKSRKKDVNLKLQRWENEGGGGAKYQKSDRAGTPGLLYAGQQFEVLDTHLVEENGNLYQVAEILPLTTKETD